MPTKKFIWDELGDNVLAELDGVDATAVEYTHLAGPYSELISRQPQSQETMFYHFDGQGSTRETTDSAHTVTNKFVYDAWGATHASSGSGTTPFKYHGANGYYADDETDRYYVRRRNYQPSLGRWVSRDPLGFVDGTGLFIFVRNNPTTLIDSSGLEVDGTWEHEVEEPPKMDCDFGYRLKIKQTFTADAGGVAAPGTQTWQWHKSRGFAIVDCEVVEIKFDRFDVVDIGGMRSPIEIIDDVGLEPGGETPVDKLCLLVEGVERKLGFNTPPASLPEGANYTPTPEQLETFIDSVRGAFLIALTKYYYINRSECCKCDDEALEQIKSKAEKVINAEWDEIMCQQEEYAYDDLGNWGSGCGTRCCCD